MFEGLLPKTVISVEARPADWLNIAMAAEEAAVLHAVPKRRAEFRAGRACARRGLLEFGIQGFPLLPNESREPRWPIGIVGSLTHSRGYCAAAIATSDTMIGVGIDVEPADPLAKELVARIFTNAERSSLRELPDVGVDWPKVIFSAKESVYKSYFPATRCHLDFEDVLIQIDPDTACFLAILQDEEVPSLSGKREFHGRFKAANGFVATALAVPRESGSPRLATARTRGQHEGGGSGCP